MASTQFYTHFMALGYRFADGATSLQWKLLTGARSPKNSNFQDIKSPGSSSFWCPKRVCNLSGRQLKWFNRAVNRVIGPNGSNDSFIRFTAASLTPFVSQCITWRCSYFYIANNWSCYGERHLVVVIVFSQQPVEAGADKLMHIVDIHTEDKSQMVAGVSGYMSSVKGEQ